MTRTFPHPVLFYVVLFIFFKFFSGFVSLEKPSGLDMSVVMSVVLVKHITSETANVLFIYFTGEMGKIVFYFCVLKKKTPNKNILSHSHIKDEVQLLKMDGFWSYLN